MTTIDVQERFLVVSHLQSDRPFRVVGSAYKKPNEKQYTFYLRLLPGIPFYIVPHRERSWEFVIFSGRSSNASGSARFFCKIGSGVYLSQNNSIELHLPDLRQVYYMKLVPQDYHFDARSEVA